MSKYDYSLDFTANIIKCLRPHYSKLLYHCRRLLRTSTCVAVVFWGNSYPRHQEAITKSCTCMLSPPISHLRRTIGSCPHNKGTFRGDVLSKVAHFNQAFKQRFYKVPISSVIRRHLRPFKFTKCKKGM